MINRTKGGMNTKLHAICDNWGRPLNLFVAVGHPSRRCKHACRAVVQRLHRGGPCSAVCQRSTGCSGIADMTPTGSEKRCRTRGYAPASPAESNARYRSNTTSADTGGATAPLVTLLFNALPDGDRDHVWQAQGLEARGNPLRQMSEGLPLRHRARRNRHLLVMNPDTSSIL